MELKQKGGNITVESADDYESLEEEDLLQHFDGAYSLENAVKDDCKVPDSPFSIADDAVMHGSEARRSFLVGCVGLRGIEKIDDGNESKGECDGSSPGGDHDKERYETVLVSQANELRERNRLYQRRYRQRVAEAKKAGLFREVKCQATVRLANLESA
ncbi:hypothetical protein L917_18608 [Phytophthora nicotianae]|uniref:BZIP domain-containing protein n=1 Tax=Phytophthora nicotianae TaxID=4792 RepID=W2K978_PHYNI|nr:hypothetical protein L917_18609 [Phytophthora nicotianae]ETL80945.1 hypothetical protein L917_18608 [Phytophthora nicotianae]